MARPKKSSVRDLQILCLAGLMLFGLSEIGVRLWFLQVKLADYYRSKARESSGVSVRVPSIRGEIRDRNGIPLVTNRPSYDVDFYLPDLVNGYRKEYGPPPMIEFRAKDANGMLHDSKEPDIVQIVDKVIIPRLEEFNIAEPYSSERLRIHYRTDSLVPFRYRHDLDFATFAKFAEANLGLPGVRVNVMPVRKYVYGALAAHILGYVGAPEDVSKLPDTKDFDFYEPDMQGKTNIEYVMDDVLQGKPGKRILKKNGKNQIQTGTEIIQPTTGSNVYLTIDARMQYIVETALRSVGRAACVVVDPNSGQILAMASVPSYDPNNFIRPISAGDWAAIKNSDTNPLTNRAISAYAPGSTFKIVTALAGLSKGLAKARFTCTGGVSYGNTYMRCWGVHGKQGLLEAIKNSCDAYFYQFGNAAGIDAIDRVGKALGIGQPTGIELTDEDPGLLPSPGWLQRTKYGRWSQGQTANTSIGQGYVLASPLQMAIAAATVANGGICYQPTLICQIQQPDGTIVRRSSRIRRDLTRDNALTKEQIELVRKGMWEVVNAPDGTGKKGAVPGIEVAGKTGTAQFLRKGKKDDRSWFLAFAPYDHPKIALAVMVEGGKSGGAVAAPIASEIMGKIFALDRGYDPGLKPLEAAVGNYSLVDSVSFKDGGAVAQLVPEGGETKDYRRSENRSTSNKVARAQQVERDVNAESHPTVQRALPVQEIRRGFFDFFRRKSEETQSNRQPQQPAKQKKKHYFLFF